MNRTRALTNFGSARELGTVAMALLLAVAAPVRGDEAAAGLRKYDKDVDRAIDRAFAYLAKNQLDDGSFRASMAQNTGITSLCVMAFLAKGHTPGCGPYGDVINKGIDFVTASAKPPGLLVGKGRSHGPMYSHTISTLMLSEVSGMVDPARQEKIDKSLPAALKVILSAQQIKKNPLHQGGWRYQHTSRDSDISCTGWAVMSLRSARGNGAEVPKAAIDDAVRFIMNCRAKDGGFAYQPRQGSGLARTGTALLCLELCGRHKDPAAIGAGDWILEHLPKRFGEGGFFYYGMYYCSQGMFQLGGKYWQQWAGHMYEMLLKFQQKDGSWPQGGGNEGKAGKCYSTAMGVLAGSVAYRQLPIYQR